ncbi:hypothetical protein GCM10010345_94220 [Streptomyces canarius]|uniref:Aminoglycoside phosphotransferase domain-containing protein n=1 Tax=Streptomyces canarius TaxID=285453 RepID=A0ABQ3DCV7_9ACTN|nr:hypothetical protein GCM10010345_94220 [Streptomyces canarius]
MGATPPAEAVGALEACFGPVSYDLLSDRRGSRAWKVTAGRTRVVLKANTPEAERSRDKAAEMAQEDEHLLRLARAGALDSAYRVGAGAWKGGRWLAVRWINGALVWNALSPPGTSKAAAERTARSCCAWPAPGPRAWPPCMRQGGRMPMCSRPTPW